MRLALCLEYPLHQHGGVEVLVCALIEELSKHHEIHLVSNDHESDIRSSAQGSLIHSHFQWMPEDHGMAQINRLIEWGTEHKIELFHFHLGGTYAWNARSWSNCPITRCAKAGFPCLTTNHQALSPFDARSDPRNLSRRLLAFLIRWPGKARQLSSVHKEIHVSQNDLKIGKSLFPLHQSKLSQIYHSRLVCPSTPELNLRNESKTILSLATVAFRKGQHILAEAFARIAADSPGWSLHLVGYHAENACVEQIRKIARDYQVEGRIHLPGSTPNPLALLQSAGIYVQPSLLEGLGLSLQEAMFHGRPCIGSKVGGIPELIDHERSGLLVAPGDPTALASALARLMGNADERARLAQAARQYIQHKHMTRQDMIHAHLETYREFEYGCRQKP